MRRAGEGKRRLEARFSSPSQRRGEPFPCGLVGGNPKSHPVWSVREGAGENSCGEQLFKGGACVGMRGQSKKRRCRR